MPALSGRSEQRELRTAGAACSTSSAAWPVVVAEPTRA